MHKKRTFLYALIKGIARLLFRTVFPVKIYGRERLAAPGPYILICNHLSWLDPVCVAQAVKGEEVTFLAKKELLKSAFGRWLMKTLHVIPVDRHNFDMAAMRALSGALKEGQVLGIFPEGTRHKQGNMQELEAGFSFLALRSGVPLVPMYIHGKIAPFRRTPCIVDAPIPLEDLRELGVGREASDALLQRITALYDGLARKAAGNTNLQK